MAYESATQLSYLVKPGRLRRYAYCPPYCRGRWLAWKRCDTFRTIATVPVLVPLLVCRRLRLLGRAGGTDGSAQVAMLAGAGV